MLNIDRHHRKALIRYMVENQQAVTNMTAEQVYKLIKDKYFFAGMVLGEAMLDFTNDLNHLIENLIKKVKRNA